MSSYLLYSKSLWIKTILKNLDSLPILHAVTTKVVVMVRDRVRDRVIIFQIRAGNGNRPGQTGSPVQEVLRICDHALEGDG